MGNGISPFHRGEKEIQSRLGNRDKMERLGRKAIRDHLPQDHQEFFPSLPCIFLGNELRQAAGF